MIFMPFLYAIGLVDIVISGGDGHRSLSGENIII